MLRVLHDRPPTGAPFMLVFKHWRRQAMASAEKLFYKVTLWLRGIPAHVWNLITTQKLLALACCNVKPTATPLAKSNLHHMTVVAWCIHPDLILVEKILYMSGSDVALVQEMPLFIDPKEVIFHNRPTLWYRVFIDIIEIEDWHTPSISSSSGGSDFGSDGDDYVCPAFSGPWLKRTSFSC
jgi:hypothetical protein